MSPNIAVDIGPMRSKVAKQILSKRFMVVLLFCEVHPETIEFYGLQLS
jgi:hypothetical protein